MKVDFIPEAKDELLEAKAWYRARNKVAAKRFAIEFYKAIGLISRFPNSGPVHLYSTRHVLVHDFPYHAIYIVEKKRLVIIAVAHASRDPAYWSSRLQ